MSWGVAATATASSLVPLWAAAVAAGAALLAGVLTQLLSGHRQKKQWINERDDRQAQWVRERNSRRAQNCQQAYAELIAAIFQWDAVLLKAIRAPEDDEAGWEDHKRAHYAAGKAAEEALPLVVFMAPQPIREQAIAAIEWRRSFWTLRLMRSPERRKKIDHRKRDDDWKALLAKKSALLDAMRTDTGLETGGEAAESSGE